MNDELQLEMIELGDAKEETKGLVDGIQYEVNDAAPFLYPKP